MPPSGDQYEIALGEQRATIVEVGGGIRSYDVGDRPVLDSYARDAICDGAHGAPLIPWPNRLGDGRYRFNGAEHQLPLSEPEHHNAIHGLLRWRSWRAIEHAPSRVVVGIRLHPLPGYPFRLDTQIAYELTPGGLAVRATARNSGDQPCPFGFGQHPYLSAGRALLDDCTLEIAAQSRIITDDRQLPTGRAPIEGTAFDYRQPRRLGDAMLDTAYTDLERDEDGRVFVTLGRPDGTSVELRADRSTSVIQLFTGDTLAPGRRRRALAVEPMTCPANAFRSGEGLIVLHPGEEFEAEWCVALR